MSLPPFRDIPDADERFAAVQRSHVEAQLRATPAERLQDLEAMWDFNEMIWSKNPQVLRIAERLWALQRPPSP